MKQCVTARAALAELKQVASRYLKAPAATAVPRGQAFGKGKLFVHSKLITLVMPEGNAFQPYR